MSGGAGASWGRRPHPLLSLEEAWERIAAEVRPGGVMSLALDQAAGRVLAAPVTAVEDYPAFDKAMMDGFAVRSADCASAGAELRVLGLVPAGEMASGGVGTGEAMQINTGAPVPAGADAVVKVEDTDPAADGSSVRVQVAVRAEQNIARQGSDQRAGAVSVAPPVRMGPGPMAAAATAGVASVEVYRPVGAAVVSTGDELAPIGQARRPGQIVDSNGPMLAALVRQFGAEPVETRLARDTAADLKAAFAEAFRQPVVVAVGGMSMGTLDLVPQVLAEMGVRWVFHGVAVKPGKPVAYGVGPDGQHVFGLPGNPVSAYLCAWLFVRMAIRGMQGFPPEPPQRWRATLAKAMKPSHDPRTAFAPARAWNDAERGIMVEPTAWGGSADPFGLASANALLVRTQPTEAAAVGDFVEVIFISETA